MPLPAPAATLGALQPSLHSPTSILRHVHGQHIWLLMVARLERGTASHRPPQEEGAVVLYQVAALSMLQIWRPGVTGGNNLQGQGAGGLGAASRMFRLHKDAQVPRTHSWRRAQR